MLVAKIFAGPVFNRTSRSSKQQNETGMYRWLHSLYGSALLVFTVPLRVDTSAL